MTLDQAKSLAQEMGRPTLETLREIVVEHGFTLGTSFEDGTLIYAASMETVPGCYGHPRFEADFHKETGWLGVSDQKPIKF